MTLFPYATTRDNFLKEVLTNSTLRRERFWTCEEGQSIINQVITERGMNTGEQMKYSIAYVSGIRDEFSGEKTKLKGSWPQTVKDLESQLNKSDIICR